MSAVPATAANVETIARQIFGRGGRSMIAAHNLLNHGNALSFKFKGSRKFTYCKITLLTDDTYKVEIGRIRKYELVGVQTTEGVYADQLRPLFERTTGLYLSL